MALAGIVLFDKVPYGGGLLFAATILLTCVATVLPHELGHALAALLVGMRLFAVTIGTQGRVLFVRQVLGYDFIFHRIPIGGHVLYTPRHLGFVRLRHFLAVLAGPLVDVLLIVIVLKFVGNTSGESRWFYVSTGFMYGNAILLAVGLFPRKVEIEQKRVPNDGLLLATIPFMSRKSIEAWHSSTFYFETMESLQRGKLQDAEQWLSKGMAVYPNDSWLLIAQAYIVHHRREYARARESYLTALRQPESTPELQAHLWNNVAWLDLMIAAPPLLEEADQFSRLAIEELPWVSCVKGTRGSVLIELGRIDEGMPLVQQALAENDRPSDKALNVCYLAIAMKRRGEISKAYEYIEQAKKLDVGCPLIERAVSELEERHGEVTRADH